MRTKESNDNLEKHIEWLKNRSKKLLPIKRKKDELKKKLLKSKDPESKKLVEELYYYKPPKIETYR